MTVSVALPVETSTLMLNFLLKTSTTGRYWRDGAPPEAIRQRAFVLRRGDEFGPFGLEVGAGLRRAAAKTAGAMAKNQRDQDQ